MLGEGGGGQYEVSEALYKERRCSGEAAVWPWTSYVTSLSLSALICKMGVGGKVAITQPMQDCSEN